IYEIPENRSDMFRELERQKVIASDLERSKNLEQKNLYISLEGEARRRGDRESAAFYAEQREITRKLDLENQKLTFRIILQ
ncbi:MAG: hypothetical protein IH948_03985, partial [Bacteroidetes bacterium]|nr:hypothetical protein [Bacteroidota bacterium]